MSLKYVIKDHDDNKYTQHNASTHSNTVRTALPCDVYSTGAAQTTLIQFSNVSLQGPPPEKKKKSAMNILVAHSSIRVST